MSFNLSNVGWDSRALGAFIVQLRETRKGYSQENQFCSFGESTHILINDSE